MTGVPDDEDEADYVAFLKHGPSCVVCTAGRPCQVNDELRAAAQAAAVAVLTYIPPGEQGYRTLRVADGYGIREVACVEVGACSWCRKATEDLIVVGVFPSDSGPGRHILACSWCVRLHELLPLSDHPEGGWCTPIHRDRKPAGFPRLRLSDYAMGDCFRCDRAGLQVKRFGEITGPEGETPPTRLSLVHRTPSCPATGRTREPGPPLHATPMIPATAVTPTKKPRPGRVHAPPSREGKGT